MSKSIKRLVKHTLSSLEVADYHKSLVCSMRAKDEAEKDFDDVKAAHKKHVADLDLEIDKYRMGCERGWEDRQVDCSVVLAPSENKKRFYRIDTGEHVGTEEMTDYDRQLTIKETEEAQDPDAQESRVKVTSRVLWAAAEDIGVMDIACRFPQQIWTFGLALRIGEHKAQLQWEKNDQGFKQRDDAVRMAGKAALKWIKQVAPDALAGFKDSINEVVESEKGKVE